MPYTINHTRTRMTKALMPLYGEAEAGQIIRMLFEHFCGISGAALILKQHEYLPIVQFDSLMAAKSALMDHVPVQYIIGSAWFADLSFEVNPSVLIPRPETEELVDIILAEAEHYPLEAGPRLLDIGTGSGCIAVALKKSLPGWQVDACDISEDALGVAGRNADKAGTAINFFKADILRWKEWSDAGSYHIIVSNPPYVCESEKKQMQPNVLEHEPDLALFVPDDDPLVFYKAIAGFAAGHLVRNGRLYLEINERYGPELSYQLTSSGFKDVEVRKDVRGKERFAVAVKEF